MKHHYKNASGFVEIIKFLLKVNVFVKKDILDIKAFVLNVLQVNFGILPLKNVNGQLFVEMVNNLSMEIVSVNLITSK